MTSRWGKSPQAPAGLALRSLFYSRRLVVWQAFGGWQAFGNVSGWRSFLMRIADLGHDPRPGADWCFAQKKTASHVFF